jgi:hypothetical protein
MRTTSLIFVTIFLGSAGLALAQPGEFFCRMWSEVPAGSTGWLTNCPCGDGGRLDQMRSQTGGIVSGVIWVELIDDYQEPVVGYPAEDIWLDRVGGGSFEFVQPGTCADGPTDIAGRTAWREPLAAGGVALTGLIAMVGGIPLNVPPLQSVRFVSFDNAGDLTVDLNDVVVFTIDFMTAYNVRSDLVHDGHIDLADLTVFTSHYGHSCP